MSMRDLTGQRFGRLEVLRFLRRAGGQYLWEVRCDCGIRKAMRAAQLRLNGAKSCGCIRREKLALGLKRTHGLSRTSEYHAWIEARNRCHDPSDPKYLHYGARGIAMCDEWRSSFERFLAHIGYKPDPSLSLGRIDNDGGYSPGNVRWETLSQQNRNRRRFARHSSV